ncbi:MAG: glycosyltransferase family 4 protein, partial [Candidatus Omnitrophica bacterium]|nr:glycosyltransferase family 4 protein [Candidatus Omnitrophota bacterium]
IKERGLVNRCILTGWQEDVSSIFPLLEVFVLSSLNEAVGMVLIEAQMMRIPVVATAVGGIPEIIQHQKTGLLVPPADAHALSRAVITLLGDTGYAQRLAEEGQRHIQERFSLAKMVEQTSVLYARLTGNSLGPRVSP